MPFREKGEFSAVWEKGPVTVRVLFSIAGVSTGIVLNTGGSTLLLDCGDGVVQALLRSGVTMRSLAGVALTHGHFDHTGALFALLGYSRMVERQSPLPVVYPRGCREVEGLVSLFEGCYPYRPFPIEQRAVAGGERAGLGPFRLTAHEVVHWGGTMTGRGKSPVPALAYTVEAEGVRVFFSGDAGGESDLDDVVRGVDLALLDSTFADIDIRDDSHLIRRVHMNKSRARRLGELAEEHMLLHRLDETIPRE